MKNITKNRNSSLVNLLLAMAICLSLLSCSKSTDTDTALPDKALPENLGYVASEKGMKLTYTVSEGEGSGSSYTAEVTDVKSENGYRVVFLKILTSGMVVNSSGRFNHKETISDGVSMPAIYYSSLEQLKKAYKTSFTHKENPMTLAIPHQDPINQVAGEAKILAEWHGVNIDENTKLTTDYTMERSNILIVDSETVETSLGKFDCLKMTYTATATSKNETTDPSGAVHHYDNVGITIITMWVAKGIGTVKTTEVMGGAVTTTELTKVEK